MEPPVRITRRAYKGGSDTPAPPRRCAWVVLLMIGKAYAPGALVVAHSLRLMRTRHDLVCLVTADVPAETRAQLSLVYDRVVEVPYIEHKALPLASRKQAESYRGWFERSFTKWNCLTLTDYDRVILVDADVVFVANVDDLFDLRAPAACYSLPWAEPWQKKGGIPNPYLQSLQSSQGSRDAADIPHGARIPAAVVMAALHENTYVGGGFLVLLEPSRETFDRFLAVIREHDVYGADYETTSAADESAIAETYARAGVDWTHIHQRYAAIPWKKEWVSRDIRGYHYLGRKPWDQDPDEWADLADWWRVADRLAAKHPQLREVFHPPATGGGSAHDADAAQLRLTNDIRGMVMAGWKDARQRGDRRQWRKDTAWREADNILERWLMALVNTPGAAAQRAPWARVYRRSSLGDGFNNKLAGELVEKRFVAGADEAGRLVTEILALVDRRLAKPPRPTGAAPACDAHGLGYGSHFHAALTPRLAQLVDLGGCDAAVAVALRYSVVVSAGQQWGLPQRHVDHLYDDFKVCGEAFASPLNARLLGKLGAIFCSVFPDTDEPFGSVGDFFALPDLELRTRNWIVNPPFVEELMTRAAQRVTGIIGPDAPQTYFFVIPAWIDSQAYKLLHECPYRVAEARLSPGEYVYEDASGKRMETKASSIYFALSTEPRHVTERLEGALRANLL